MPLSVDQQIRALVEIVGTVAGSLSQLSSRVDRLADDVRQASADGEPAEWVCGVPPAGDDATATVQNFVTFYNATYVGTDGGRSKPIPPCWQAHLALAAEVASLAYMWRAANVGPTANIRDAQQWHHQWRPGFADRMARDWLHADCFDGVHRPSPGERPVLDGSDEDGPVDHR